MSFALSQHGPDRHPVGLLVVVGLHVVLAAVLVSAKLATRPSEPLPIALTPREPPQRVDRTAQPLPPATPPNLPMLKIPTPLVPSDPVPDAPVARIDDHATPADPLIVDAGHDDGSLVHQAARVLARAARIDAAAAQCRPEYPSAAQRAGVTGVTRIRFSVDATGRVAGAQILQASGGSREHRMMDKAAADALAQCPVQVGTDEMGRPVGTTTDVEYVWKLD